MLSLNFSKKMNLEHCPDCFQTKTEPIKLRSGLYEHTCNECGTIWLIDTLYVEGQLAITIKKGKN